jgi:hypothetical protein
LQGNVFKNKEILNGWKEIMFFENGSTGTFFSDLNHSTNMAAVLKVKIQADAFMVCLAHALSTDREEVMGLLIGEVG